MLPTGLYNSLAPFFADQITGCTYLQGPISGRLFCNTIYAVLPVIDLSLDGGQTFRVHFKFTTAQLPRHDEMWVKILYSTTSVLSTPQM